MKTKAIAPFLLMLAIVALAQAVAARLPCDSHVNAATKTELPAL